MKTIKLHKVTLYVVDRDELGSEGLAEAMRTVHHRDHCVHARQIGVETVDISLWSDLHRCNMNGTDLGEYFKEEDEHIAELRDKIEGYVAEQKRLIESLGGSKVLDGCVDAFKTVLDDIDEIWELTTDEGDTMAKNKEMRASFEKMMAEEGRIWIAVDPAEKGIVAPKDALAKDEALILEIRPKHKLTVSDYGFRVTLPCGSKMFDYYVPWSALPILSGGPITRAEDAKE